MHGSGTYVMLPQLYTMHAACVIYNMEICMIWTWSYMTYDFVSRKWSLLVLNDNFPDCSINIIGQRRHPGLTPAVDIYQCIIVDFSFWNRSCRSAATLKPCVSHEPATKTQTTLASSTHRLCQWLRICKNWGFWKSFSGSNDWPNIQGYIQQVKNPFQKTCVSRI